MDVQGFAKGSLSGRRHSLSPWRAFRSHLYSLLAVVLVLSLPFQLQRVWPVLAYGVLKVVAYVAQPSSCHCPENATAAAAASRRDAIVFLVQRKRMAMLMESLQHLHRYFNNCYRKPVLLFHNGDFKAEDQQQVIKDFPLVQFHFLEVGGKYWQVPPNLNQSGSWQSSKGYSEGYRHMCRFHYKMVFEYMESKGYDWFMRLDDDSFILSCIEYDLFQFMRDRNFLYGWRLAQLEYHEFAQVLPELVDKYMLEKKIPSSWLLNSHFEGGTLSAQSWDRWTYYNNFMITRVSWWRSGMVSRWLDRVDSSGITYVNRVGDAPVQTFTQMMFLPNSQVHHFQDWSYIHGPLIALTISSLLPASVRSLVLEEGQQSEWVAGLYNMSESPFIAPLLKRLNAGLQRVGISWR